MTKIFSNLQHSLTGPIAPTVWLFVVLGMFIGVVFGMNFDFVQDSVLHSTVYIGLGKDVWGWLLFGASTAGFVGLWKELPAITGPASTAVFMLWSYATILLFIGGHYYVMITVGLLNVLAWAYIFLANSVGALRRRTLTGARQDDTI